MAKQFAAIDLACRIEVVNQRSPQMALEDERPLLSAV